MPPEPNAVGNALALILAALFGTGGLAGWQKIRRRNGNGVNLGHVVAAIKDEGSATRRAIHETSSKQIEKTGEVATGVEILVDRGLR